MSSFFISCGGTGGHLSPGISLAEGLVAQGHSVRLLISQKKVDARLIEKYPQFEFIPISGTGFSFHPLRLLRCCVSQVKGLVFCYKLVREHRPHGIIGFGGFTSTGVVVAGRWLNVPVALHESNRVPGRAIRTLGRFAARVYLPQGIRLPGISSAAIRHIGLPVRSEIVRVAQVQARVAIGLDPAQRTLVVFGGSQGARVLNEWVRNEFPRLAAEGIQVCCITGLGKGKDEFVELTSKKGVRIRAHFRTFSDRVAELLSSADLVVSRAGAGTIAELIRCETPAVLVPFPHAADDHQRANAAFFERQGAGLVVEQDGIAGLTSEVLDVIFNDALLRTFRNNLERMGRTDPLSLMLADLQEIVGQHGSREMAMQRTETRVT
jgi:UDP-N-acetylglucosamine--N-acetylmuramyl-(pentapeptide) pyrophosphoryl-undecaprenol N-acetylglucosamine transferase